MSVPCSSRRGVRVHVLICVRPCPSANGPSLKSAAPWATCTNTHVQTLGVGPEAAVTRLISDAGTRGGALWLSDEHFLFTAHGVLNWTPPVSWDPSLCLRHTRQVIHHDILRSHRSIQRVTDWICQHFLLFNKDKTKIIVFWTQSGTRSQCSAWIANN